MRSSELTITRPTGEVERHYFSYSEEAQRWADDLLFGMDTSEARETGFEISEVEREEALLGRCPVGHEEFMLATSFNKFDRDCNRCGAPLVEVRRGLVRTYPISIPGRHR